VSLRSSLPTPPGRPVATLAAIAVALLLLAPVTVGLAFPADPIGPPDSPGTDPAPVSVPDTPATSEPAPESSPVVAAVYPNPVPDGDRGEFVRIDPRGENLSGYRLVEGDTSHSLPAVSEPVTLTDAPDRLANRTGWHTRRAELSLANAGERLRLVDDRNRTVSVARYGSAPESEVYVRTDDAESATDSQPRWQWRPLGRTDFAVATGGPANATAFVLPDAPDVTPGALRAADRRVLLAGYTFTSERAATALVRARERGVRVRVLLEGSPVGGLTRREARLLDRLVDAGIDVRVLAGPHDRYAYHHAKYAIVDDRALVLTENWKPAGTGGASSRGWGALVRDPDLARSLAAVFRADAGWRDAVPWERFRRGRAFEPSTPARGTFPRRFAPDRLRVEATRLLVTPDNGERALVDLLDDAEESIRVVGPTLAVDARPTRALVRAAERGVRVRVLLSSAWYVRDENRRTADRLNALAEREGLSLTVRLVDADADGFRKIHAKGAVVDGEQVVLGSLNWNPQSASENREVVLVLEGERVGAYYARVFDADWRGRPRWPVPPAAVAAAGIAALAALAILRRIEFGDDHGVGGPEEW